MAQGLKTILVRFASDTTGLRRGTDDAARQMSKLEKANKLANKALVGVGVAAGVGLSQLKAGLEGIQEGADAEAKLAQALENSSAKRLVNTAAVKAQASAIQKSTKFTYEDALAVDAFLVAQDGFSTALKNGSVTTEEATRTVLDLAQAQGIDATAAAKQYAKALNNPFKAAAALRKQGVVLTASELKLMKQWEKSGDTAKAQALVQDKLAAKYKGTAVAAGKTLGGQLIIAKNAFGEVQESLAKGLLPAVTAVLAKVTQFTGWAEDNPGKVRSVAIVVGVLVGVLGTFALVVKTVIAVQKAWVAVQTALNIVMSLNPVAAVIIAVVALVAAIVIAYKKSEKFRSIVQGLWQVFKDLWGIVKGLGEALFAPFDFAFNKIKDVYNRLGIGKIIGAIGKIGGGIKSGIGKIPGFAGGGRYSGGPMVVGERGPELLVPGGSGRVVPNSALEGGTTVIEIHGAGLESVIEKVVVRRDRATKNASRAGSRRSYAY